MNQEQLKEDGAVAAPGNVTAGVEAPKLPIKPGKANIFKRVQTLKKKKDALGPQSSI
jgi:hypothetical protein